MAACFLAWPNAESFSQNCHQLSCKIICYVRTLLHFRRNKTKFTPFVDFSSINICNIASGFLSNALFLHSKIFIMVDSLHCIYYIEFHRLHFSFSSLHFLSFLHTKVVFCERAQGMPLTRVMMMTYTRWILFCRCIGTVMFSHLACT